MNSCFLSVHYSNLLINNYSLIVRRYFEGSSASKKCLIIEKVSNIIPLFNFTECSMISDILY